MKISVEFESMEEFEAFRTSGKKTRTKKEEADEATTGSAPAPLQPPAGGAVQGFNPAGFAPPAGGAALGAGAFPAAAAQPSVAPEIVALVNRIVTKLDAAIASGQSAEQALAWMRGECIKCGIDASSYTLDQVKQAGLPKMSMPALENMAKLMAA